VVFFVLWDTNSLFTKENAKRASKGNNDGREICRLRTYRNNVDRYRRLLKTELSEIERQFIERRLNEEKSAMESLAISAHTQVEKTPSEHFMKSVHDELAFERKEIEFQKTERYQRASRLRLPISKHYTPLSTSATDGSAGPFRSSRDL
jgi:hypothetical protein